MLAVQTLNPCCVPVMTLDLVRIVKVARLRLLGDYHHSTRIAFVEFVMVSVALFPLLTLWWRQSE